MAIWSLYGAILAIIRGENNMKYYAIRKGYKTGIFTNWDEAEKLIKGFSGAEFKSFNNLQEAQKFLENNLQEKMKLINK